MIRSVLAPIGFSSVRRWAPLREAHKLWAAQDALHDEAALAPHDPGPPPLPKRAILPPGGSSALVARLYGDLGRPAPARGHRRRRADPAASGIPKPASGVTPEFPVPASPVAPAVLRAESLTRKRLLHAFAQQRMASAA